jgi:hypothetical protein
MKSRNFSIIILLILFNLSIISSVVSSSNFSELRFENKTLCKIDYSYVNSTDFKIFAFDDKGEEISLNYLIVNLSSNVSGRITQNLMRSEYSIVIYNFLEPIDNLVVSVRGNSNGTILEDSYNYEIENCYTFNEKLSLRARILDNFLEDYRKYAMAVILSFLVLIMVLLILRVLRSRRRNRKY